MPPAVYGVRLQCATSLSPFVLHDCLCAVSGSPLMCYMIVTACAVSGSPPVCYMIVSICAEFGVFSICAKFGAHPQCAASLCRVWGSPPPCFVENAYMYWANVILVYTFSVGFRVYKNSPKTVVVQTAASRSVELTTSNLPDIGMLCCTLTH